MGFMPKMIEEGIVYKKSNVEGAPLVMLFGWAGCRDRYLAKYSAIYEQRDFSILRFTAPVTRIRSYTCYRQFALSVYDQTLDLGVEEVEKALSEGGIFFHLFSMNGCSLFSAFWDLLSTMPNGVAVKKCVKGVVFDSSPANVSPWQGAHAISFASMPPSRYSALSRTTYRYFLTTVFSIHRAGVWARSLTDPDVWEQNYSYFRLIGIPDLPRNQLYLYSQADVICSADSIEKFQTSQLERGCSVTTKCWKDSPHVEHYRYTPDEYTSACNDFLNNAMKEENAPSENANGVVQSL